MYTIGPSVSMCTLYSLLVGEGFRGGHSTDTTADDAIAVVVVVVVVETPALATQLAGQFAHTSLTRLNTLVVPPKCGNMPARLSCVETRLVVLRERSRWFASAPLFIVKQPSVTQVVLYMYMEPTTLFLNSKPPRRLRCSSHYFLRDPSRSSGSDGKPENYS